MQADSVCLDHKLANTPWFKTAVFAYTVFTQIVTFTFDLWMFKFENTEQRISNQI